MIFVFIPLVVLLIGLSCVEWKTKLIPDAVIFPAVIYFLVVRIIIGPHSWWHYPLALIGTLTFFILFAALTERVFGSEWLGGGAIKMTACVGLALGLTSAALTGFIFLIFLLAGLLVMRFSNISSLPAPPLMLLSVLLLFFCHYVNFPNLAG